MTRSHRAKPRRPHVCNCGNHWFTDADCPDPIAFRFDSTAPFADLVLLVDAITYGGRATPTEAA